MPTLQPRECKNCGAVYQPTGPAQKVCATCKSSVDRARTLAYGRKYYDKNFRVGCGSGGNQDGDKNPNWKGGTSTYREIKLNSLTHYACERCGTDLSDVIHTLYGWGLWVVHHKDGDHDNVALENLELLCKSCHQIEHRCWENFDAKV